jgi:UrcA family protein
MKSIISATTITLVLALTGAAQAAVIQSNDSVTVNTSELNLTTAEGRNALESRLRKAASKVCGSTSLRIVGSVSRLQENKACYKATLAKALEEARITSQYPGKTGAAE